MPFERAAGGFKGRDEVLGLGSTQCKATLRIRNRSAGASLSRVPGLDLFEETLTSRDFRDAFNSPSILL
mgnify:CR=1 FL=1